MLLRSMRPQTFLQFGAGVLLLVLYVTLLVFVLRPHVTPEYRAYYIDRTSSDWNPVRYPASFEEGIRFTNPGFPEFVQLMYGFSFHEPWGRWTDARRSPVSDRPVAGIVFREPLSGPVCVDVNARPAQPNESVTVALGNEEKNVVFSRSEFADYFIEFSLTRPANAIEFRFRGRIRSAHEENPKDQDIRRLGLAIVSLRFFPYKCGSVQEKAAQRLSQN